MKNYLRVLTLAVFTTIAYSSNAQTNDTLGTSAPTWLFPRGQKLTQNFSGSAYLQPLLPRDKNNDFALGSVTFTQGARTYWHTHPKGQVLIVTDGEGWYQEKGQPARPIKKGDVVNVPENTEHWHGAGTHTQMIHIALTNYKAEENVKWLQPVSETDYSHVNQK